MGDFSKGSGSRKNLLVATDYFTKWVEAVPFVYIAEYIKCEEFLMRKHHHQIWNPENVGLEYWHSIEKLEDTQVLQKIWHQKVIL